MIANEVKNAYRLYFANVQKYVKMSVLLKDLNISQANYSSFVKSAENNNKMSLDNLMILEKYVHSVLDKAIRNNLN